MLLIATKSSNSTKRRFLLYGI